MRQYQWSLWHIVIININIGIENKSIIIKKVSGVSFKMNGCFQNAIIEIFLMPVLAKDIWNIKFRFQMI